MSGLNGPHTQATGFNFSHSQLDSQPNYSFADSTQDGNACSDYPEFSNLTQVSRSLSLWALAASAHICTLLPGITSYNLHGRGFTLLVLSSPPFPSLLLVVSSNLLLQDTASQAAWNDAIQASALVWPIHHVSNRNYNGVCLWLMAIFVADTHRQQQPWMGQRLQASAAASHLD